MKILPFMGLLLLSSSIFAQCDFNGNCYTVNPTYNGYDVHGYNFNTGSMWNTTIQNNGNMNGWDSNGNYWQYNNNSGNYYNYGTGKTCYGFGYARQCY